MLNLKEIEHIQTSEKSLLLLLQICPKMSEELWKLYIVEESWLDFSTVIFCLTCVKPFHKVGVIKAVWLGTTNIGSKLAVKNACRLELALMVFKDLLEATSIAASLLSLTGLVASLWTISEKLFVSDGQMLKSY